MNKYEKKFNYISNHMVGKFDNLQELVERATPKKVVYCENSETYECDDCGRKLNTTYKYCPNCGQALR